MNNEIVPAELDYRELIATYGSPLLVLDQAAVRKQYRSLVNALPGVRMHYALKPLPHSAVVATLKAEGCGFDLATNGEVDVMLENQITPDLVS